MLLLIVSFMIYLNPLVSVQQENYAFITKWGSTGSERGQFRDPYSLAVDSAGSVYVGDLENHRIQKFDSDGKFLKTWGSEGSKKDELKFPEKVIFDSSTDNLYVADRENNRIKKFDSEGKLVMMWGTKGTA